MNILLELFGGILRTTDSESHQSRAEKTNENRGKWKCKTFQGNYRDAFLNDLEMARLASCYDVEITVECYVFLRSETYAAILG